MHANSNEDDRMTQIRIPFTVLAEALRKACQRQHDSDVQDARKPRKVAAKQKLGEVERLTQELMRRERELRNKGRELRNKDRESRKKN